MTKLDWKKDLKELYRPPAKQVVTVTVPAMSFLMVDGAGDPNSSKQFQPCVEALYGLSFTIKFGRKKRGDGPDYAVFPLEGLWWMPGGQRLDMERKDQWRWTLLIAQPDFVTDRDVTIARDELAQKKHPPKLSDVRFAKFDEGQAVQVMHVGPYAEEEPTIARMLAYTKEHKLTPHGKHHEIYLGDPRRTKPEKLKTVLRQPVR